MTGATTTESPRKLTPETRFTHQKNPVRKGKKGGEKTTTTKKNGRQSYNALTLQRIQNRDW